MLTGSFATNDGAKLALTSWVSVSANLSALQLENQGTLPLTISSTLRDGFGTPGNNATAGAGVDTTWMRISPDILNLELGNRLLGRDKPPESSKPPESPFKGEIADFRLYDSALTEAAIQNLDAPGIPRPFYAWSASVPAQLKATARLDLSAPHGGSVVLDGSHDGELWGRRFAGSAKGVHPFRLDQGWRIGRRAKLSGHGLSQPGGQSRPRNLPVTASTEKQTSC